MIVEQSDFDDFSFTMNENESRIIAGLLHVKSYQLGVDEPIRQACLSAYKSIKNARRGMFSKKREICICPKCEGAKEIFIENELGERETICCTQCLGDGILYVATHIHMQPLTDELRETLIK